jgi:aspartokinase-like uncharacterized kinase
MSATVVIKVGGSLLDWPELPARLNWYLERRRGQRLVLIAGGGRFADVLRELDRVHGLGEERSHALALRILDATSHLLAALVAGSRVVDALEQFEPVWQAGEIPVLAPRNFLDRDGRSPDPLPHTWATTTDSIAARVATRIEADELVLLKSATPPEGASRVEAVRLGLVDPEFAAAARGLRVVKSVGLRENTMREVSL